MNRKIILNYKISKSINIYLLKQSYSKRIADKWFKFFRVNLECLIQFSVLAAESRIVYFELNVTFSHKTRLFNKHSSLTLVSMAHLLSKTDSFVNAVRPHQPQTGNYVLASISFSKKPICALILIHVSNDIIKNYDNKVVIMSKAF